MTKSGYSKSRRQLFRRRDLLETRRDPRSPDLWPPSFRIPHVTVHVRGRKGPEGCERAGGTYCSKDLSRIFAVRADRSQDFDLMGIFYCILWLLREGRHGI